MTEEEKVSFRGPGLAPPPSNRLDTSENESKRRRVRLLNAINAVLCVALALIAVVLLGTFIPRLWFHHRVRPYSEHECTDPFSHCPVLLISMDGFRHDYLEKVRARYGPDALPNFRRMEREGIRAMRSINAYPTITMPNHRTLITGLYPESHGVVANNLIDLNWPGVQFEMNNQTSLNEAPWLDHWPEPIWTTAQRHGHLVGSLLWPLTDGPVRGDLPFMQVSQFTTLDSMSVRYPYTKRVDDLIWWLDNPRYRLSLVMAYFDEPDETGHAYGPDSEQVAQRVVELDGILGRLLDGLKAKGVLGKVDIILTADHGMTSIDRSRLIAMDRYVSRDSYTATQLSTMGFLYPQPGRFDEVYANLSKAHEHLHVYRSADVPAYLYFNRNSSRLPPLVLIPDPGWYLVHNESQHTSAGDHGYVPTFDDMSPFFIAHGPSFRQNTTVPVVYAIDVYALMNGLLRLAPHRHNGSLERIAHALLKPEVAELVLNTPPWLPRLWVWLIAQLQLLWFLVGFVLWVVLFATLISLIYLQRRYTRTVVTHASVERVDYI